MITLVCSNCGIEYTTQEAWAKRRKKNFCSKKCHYEHKRGVRVELVCEQCGKKFLVKPSQLINKGKYKKKYCSLKCRAEANKRVERVCRVCGKAYSLVQSKKDFCNDFCSKACWHKYMVGDNNPNWRDGSSNFPYCKKFNNALRESIRDKYGRKCLNCGRPESENFSKSGRHFKLAIHHIRYNKNEGCDGKEMWLCPLCIYCHPMTNGHREEWQDKLEKKKKLFEGVCL